MQQYVEVIVPLPLNATFTYSVPAEMMSKARPGHRVIVPFGRKKFYTAIVVAPVSTPPSGMEVKEIYAAIDNEPVLRRPQLQLWRWIADYYLCTVGDVMRAALPAALKIESETFIELFPDYEEDVDNPLTEREAIVVQVLDHHAKRMSIGEIEHATGLKNVGALTSRLLDKGVVMISEKLVERYHAKKVNYVSINAERGDAERVRALFSAVKGAPKQEKALQTLLHLSGFMLRDSPLTDVSRDTLLEQAQVTTPILTAMAKKGVINILQKEINRFKFEGATTAQLPELSAAQDAALNAIHKSWLGVTDITLLRGVTSSGKTEIYIHLFDYVLRQRRQALMLVPEIALTTQLTRRLQNVFGEQVIVYHSKFSDNERVDIWKRMLAEPTPCIVIGARSSVFLPFSDLGLVVVDEEHESSYKQENPAPRYNGRDTAMVLARMHGAKVLLGSATPSIETYWKAVNGKYGLVELTERYGGVPLPKIEIVNTLSAKRRGLMHGIIAESTENMVRNALAKDHQAILFLNRRGYSPVAECKMCAYTPKCQNCDVTLTYHKHIDRMVCHYCGAVYPVSHVCPSCKEPAVEIFGYGTERIEDEVDKRFPNVNIARMDLDTTRNKDGYEKIIDDFSSGNSRILVGTQMVTKGLDFTRVTAVAVLNADAQLNMPDFRANERAFNMLEQVAGRAGRRDKEGIVAIQTRQPDHPVFPFILAHDYKGFYDYEIEERRKFNYPPFTRVIYIYLRHRDRYEVDSVAVEFTRRLKSLFGNRVFGPEEPVVARVQTLYIRKIMLKIEVNASMQKVKQILRNAYEDMMSKAIGTTRSTLISYDVDPC